MNFSGKDVNSFASMASGNAEKKFDQRNKLEIKKGGEPTKKWLINMDSISHLDNI